MKQSAAVKAGIKTDLNDAIRQYLTASATIVEEVDKRHGILRVRGGNEPPVLLRAMAAQFPTVLVSFTDRGTPQYFDDVTRLVFATLDAPEKPLESTARLVFDIPIDAVLGVCAAFANQKGASLVAGRAYHLPLHHLTGGAGPAATLPFAAPTESPAEADDRDIERLWQPVQQVIAIRYGVPPERVRVIVELC